MWARRIRELQGQGHHIMVGEWSLATGVHEGGQAWANPSPNPKPLTPTLTPTLTLTLTLTPTLTPTTTSVRHRAVAWRSTSRRFWVRILTVLVFGQGLGVTPSLPYPYP